MKLEIEILREEDEIDQRFAVSIAVHTGITQQNAVSLEGIREMKQT